MDMADMQGQLQAHPPTLDVQADMQARAHNIHIHVEHPHVSTVAYQYIQDSICDQTLQASCTGSAMAVNFHAAMCGGGLEQHQCTANTADQSCVLYAQQAHGVQALVAHIDPSAYQAVVRKCCTFSALVALHHRLECYGTPHLPLRVLSGLKALLAARILISIVSGALKTINQPAWRADRRES